MSRVPIIAVGASAGGVEALHRFVGALPGHLPAAVLVVLHVPAGSPSVLAGLLNRWGPLPAANAEDGETIRPGRIYVAQPGQHLLLEDDHLVLSRGPKENGHRPAIDVLFRAVAEQEAGAAGVVLSGALDDGTAGLAAIKGAGGLTAVQDPADALYPSMPQSAMTHVETDIVATPGEIAARLRDWASPRPPPETGTAPEPAASTGNEPNPGERPHWEETVSPPPDEAAVQPSPYACPDCYGVLWEVDDDRVVRFRCRVGHAWSASSLLAQQADSFESALWAALRVLEERASLCARLADGARKQGHVFSATGFEARGQEATESAASIARLLEELQIAPSEGGAMDAVESHG